MELEVKANKSDRDIFCCFGQCKRRKPMFIENSHSHE